MKKFIIGGIITLAVAGTAAVAAVTYVNSKLNKVERTEIKKEEIHTNEIEEHEALSGYTNIALFGVDTREGELEVDTRTDTIMIASINNDTKEIKLVSVFRDTYLDMAAENKTSYNKANAAYSQGGPKQAIDMLNKNLDLNIEDYATVDFSALAVTIDLLGGVDIELTDEEIFWMNGYVTETREVTGIYTDYFEGAAGTHTLNGIQATSFCRIRYTAGDDYRRAERQREVLEQIFLKAKEMDLSTLNEILDEVLPMVSTSLSSAEIIKLGTSALSYELSEQTGFPFELFTSNVSGKGDCVIPNDLVSNVKELHRILFGIEDYEPSETVKQISNAIKTYSKELEKNEDNSLKNNDTTDTETKPEKKKEPEKPKAPTEQVLPNDNGAGNNNSGGGDNGSNGGEGQNPGGGSSEGQNPGGSGEGQNPGGGSGEGQTPGGSGEGQGTDGVTE